MASVIGWFSAVFAVFNTTNDDWIREDENMTDHLFFTISEANFFYG